MMTERHFDATPNRLARGEYLARVVLGCLDCHSEHDWRAPGAAIVPGRDAAEQIFPGHPHGISDGASADPIMPWDTYCHMNDEDLKAILAYLRTVKPVENREERRG
jgi:mono/diheme cytochrome c family protein